VKKKMEGKGKKLIEKYGEVERKRTEKIDRKI